MTFRRGAEPNHLQRARTSRAIRSITGRTPRLSCPPDPYGRTFGYRGHIAWGYYNDFPTERRRRPAEGLA